MINFFRKIRKKLLNESKVTRYLIYALGEILLIVIGILIALQINNWNLNKIREHKEVELLQLIKSDLEEGISEFDRSINQYSKAKKSILHLLNSLETNEPYNDSLKYHFFNSTLYWGTSDLTNTSYETLKTIGIDLISNQELRDKTSVLFDEYDSWIEKDESRYLDIIIDAGKTVMNTRFNEYWNGELIDGEYVGEMIPLDYEKLKTDQEFLFFLRSLKNQMKWLVEEPIISTRIEVLNLIELIDDELIFLEKN